MITGITPTDHSVGNSQGGQASHLVTPLQRLMLWGQHPTINRLRQVGKVSLTLPKKYGDAPFTLNGKPGRLNFYLRGDGMVTIKNTAQSIDEIVDKDVLISIIKAAKPKVESASLWLQKKGEYALVDVKQIRNFLVGAEVMKGV